MSQEPKITFPCTYPLKIIGYASSEFLSLVIDIVKKYDGSISLDKIKERKSRNGNYHSITVLFWALNEVQITEVYEELIDCHQIKMVL